jgi:hypothetical protein
MASNIHKTTKIIQSTTKRNLNRVDHATIKNTVVEHTKVFNKEEATKRIANQ